MKLRPQVKVVIDFVKLLFVAFVIMVVVMMVCKVKPVDSANMPEYFILTAPYSEDLEALVFGKLIDGYDLKGDLVVVKGNNGLEYFQVVTK